ncbi:hypothetical protein EUTSA_v10023867mg, partial [Eutrema salsugineum]
RLAFESIPQLKDAYRAHVEQAKSSCPRMCKKEFIKTGEKGYPLKNIYEVEANGRELPPMTKDFEATHRKKVELYVGLMTYLLRQGLPFRGHNELVDSINKGIFLELVKYTAEQNEIVSKVVLENAPKNNQMVSHKIQTEIVHCFAEEVIEFNGLRALILRENNFAYYVHCFAHQLQLVVITIAQKHFEVGDFFDMIVVLLNVVGASCKRKYMNYNIELLVMEEEFIDSMNPRMKSNKTNLHHYKVECFYTIFDIQIQESNDRFDEVNIELFGCIESLSLIDSFHEFDQFKVMRLSEFYPEDFSQERVTLEHQLGLYTDNIRGEERFSNVKDFGDLARVMVETKNIFYILWFTDF